MWIGLEDGGFQKKESLIPFLEQAKLRWEAMYEMQSVLKNTKKIRRKGAMLYYNQYVRAESLERLTICIRKRIISFWPVCSGRK